MPETRAMKKRRIQQEKILQETNSNSITKLPEDILKEILVRVGATSCKALMACKFTCRKLYHLTADPYVLKHVSLRTYPLNIMSLEVERRDGSKAFFWSCRDSGNPDALFRQGMADYFKLSGDSKSGLKYLKAAAETGHRDALYILDVILGGKLELLASEEMPKELDRARQLIARFPFC